MFKRFTLLLSFFFIVMSMGFAQLTMDDFESYDPGLFDPQWDPTEWVGWFSATSNAFISEDFANSGTKSVKIEDAATTTDLVGLFGIINSGLYELTFMQYIPVGSGAYFNLQHNYTNTAGDWAAEIYFGDDNLGTARIVTDAVPTNFTPVFGEWVENKFIFDFGGQEAQYFYDGDLILTWALNTNASGGPGLNQINGLNLYAACDGTGCSSLAYYDDINIADMTPDFDAALVSGDRPEYTIIPAGHMAPITLNAEVANGGTNDVTDVTVTLNVRDGSNSVVFTESTTPVASLSSGSSTTVSGTNPWSTNVPDTYTLEYRVTIMENDMISANDKVEYTLEISDSTYARDDGNYPSGLGVNNGGGILGNQFDLLVDASIPGVETSYQAGVAGDSLLCRVYSMSNGVPDAQIGQSDYFEMVGAGAPGAPVFVDMKFSPPLDLTAGEYLFAIEQVNLNNMVLSTSPSIYTPNKGFATLDNGATWSTLESLNFPITMHIRPTVAAGPVSNEFVFTQEFVQVSPNPSTGFVNVLLHDLDLSQADVRVFSVDGTQVFAQRNVQVNGEILPLNLEALQAGMYIIQLSNGDRAFQAKVVKE